MKNFNAKNFVIKVIVSGALLFCLLLITGNGFIWEYEGYKITHMYYPGWQIVIACLMMWFLFYGLVSITWNSIK